MVQQLSLRGRLQKRHDLTVGEYAERWIAGRRGRVVSVEDEWSRLKLHALPILGYMTLNDVRPRHLHDLVWELRRGNRLAPRTICHVYGTLATMFHSAVAEELIPSTPCVVSRGILPKKTDRDPSWRDDAIYAREEAEALMYDPRLLPDRRVFYALKYLAALRHSEAARLRWRDIRPMEPLSQILLEKTKTGIARRVPIHPALGELLFDWRVLGWPRVYGRAPTQEDLVVPTRRLSPRVRGEARNALLRDLAQLELRTHAGRKGQSRRGHDLRRTFISLAQEDGAVPHILRFATHGATSQVWDLYTTLPWRTLCAEVSKLRVLHPRMSDLAGRVDAMNGDRCFVTPPGIEPGEVKSAKSCDSASLRMQRQLRGLARVHACALAALDAIHGGGR